MENSIKKFEFSENDFEKKFKKKSFDLLNKSNEKVLFFKNPVNLAIEMANPYILDLRRKVDYKISRVKHSERLKKISSLESRFNLMKSKAIEDTLNSIDSYRILYLDILQLNEKNRDELKVIYMDEIDEVIIAINVDIEEDKEGIYLKNKDDFSNTDFSKVKKIILSNSIEGLKYKNKDRVINMSERLKFLIGELNFYDYEIENLERIELDDKILNSILNYNNDLMLLNDRYDIATLYIAYNYFINNKKIMIVSDNIEKSKIESNEIISKREIEEIFNTKKNNEEYIQVKNILNKDIGRGYSLSEEFNNIKNFNFYNSNEYKNYKKNINLNGITYNDLNEILKNINRDDISIYIDYKYFKKRMGYFGDYYQSDDEIIAAKEYIKSLLTLSTKSYEYNKNYYKKIMFKIKEKNNLLNNLDIGEIANNIAREKNRELIIQKKSWSISNLFNSNKNKETEKENLKKLRLEARKEMQVVSSIYQTMELDYKRLKSINNDLFMDVVRILCKDNFKEELKLKIENIDYTQKNRSLIAKINLWTPVKLSLVEFLADFEAISIGKELILKFKVIDEVIDVCKSNDINIKKNIEFYKTYKPLDDDFIKNQKLKLFYSLTTKNKIVFVDKEEFLRNKYDEKFDLILFDNIVFNTEKGYYKGIEFSKRSIFIFKEKECLDIKLKNIEILKLD